MVQDIFFDGWLQKNPNSSQSLNAKYKPNKRKILINEPEVEWIKLPNSVSGRSIKYYKFAKVGELFINEGDNVMVAAEEHGEPPQIGQVAYMFENQESDKICHVHFYCRGTDTIMGKKSDPRELFLVDHCEDIRLNSVLSKAQVQEVSYASKWNTMGGPDEVHLNDSDDGKHYHFSKRYDYNKSQFVDFIDRKAKCIACFWQQEEVDFNTPKYVEVYMGDSYVEWQEVKYYIRSGVFLETGSYRAREPEARKVESFYTFSHINGDVVRLSKSDREILYPEKHRKQEKNVEASLFMYPLAVGVIEHFRRIKDNIHIKIRIFYRYEDVHNGQSGDPYLLYWTNEFYNIKGWKEWTSLVKGKCFVSNKIYIQDDYQWIREGPYRFYFEHRYVIKSRKVDTNLPKESRDIGLPRNLSFLNRPIIWPEIKDRLKSMDIYAGCGGLSDGLERSGLVDTKWAIEIDTEIAASFQLNHPLVNVFKEDCNNVLKMLINNQHHHLNLPEKGEVDVIVGGPPCQGFSVLNRCCYGKNSSSKNSQIKTYLGFIEYYRPKYFVYENVQNFVSFKSNFYFKSTLKCMLAMGYQVSFGVLQAGNYGLPQSRRRLFIIGAAPGLKLPSLPEPTHCFLRRTQCVKVDNLMYDTGETVTGAFGSLPYRAVSVKDAIFDLPPVHYDEMKSEISYSGSSQTSFYAQSLREYANRSDLLSLHECKPVSEIVQKRIEYIPPEGDWRDLPNISIRLEDNTQTDILPYVYRTINQPQNSSPRGVCPCINGDACLDTWRLNTGPTLIPWNVAHTASKNNNWRGVYGRLHWDGYFNTVTTEPEPTRTQGKVLHPDQDRIISLRECARAQGFHDEFQFAGTKSKIYKQIGNAVPPILATVIGREIIKAINQHI